MSEDKLKEKYKVFGALLKKKQEEYDRIQEYQRGELKSINEADLDRSEMIESQTENMMREMRTESETLDHLKEEINYLEDFKSYRERDKIGPATLVKTNIGNFLVSVPEPLFESNGEKFSGITVKSPIYEALEGKKEGDKVHFNGRDIEIKMVV